MSFNKARFRVSKICFSSQHIRTSYQANIILSLHICYMTLVIFNSLLSHINKITVHDQCVIATNSIVFCLLQCFFIASASTFTCITCRVNTCIKLRIKYRSTNGEVMTTRFTASSITTGFLSRPTIANARVFTCCYLANCRFSSFITPFSLFCSTVIRQCQIYSTRLIEVQFALICFAILNRFFS